ncbi:HPr family phosphocarrier protein [bacterium]|nr:HPr family phosphocarrier protein [bacterium]MBU1753016.1 HPr family phosphocarrier protein [bacterium]
MKQLTESVIIQNKSGLHARAASIFVHTASRFSSKIEVGKNGTNDFVNGKSILGVLCMAVSPGSKIVIRAVGKDAEAAMIALIELINNKFGEEE